MYIADRQISVRLGQAFWSRGPSLSSKFTAKDFPSLQTNSTGGEDHASVLQATMDLTQLLHNAHDILYSSHARTQELILAGDYNRYLDDFHKALLSWDETWHHLASSPRIKCALTLMYEYLCLYVNAFAFQARITQLLNEARVVPKPQQPIPLRNYSIFPRGIMATPEGRYIFEALRAAKAVLKVMSEADSASCVRYMPTRYYLYVFSPTAHRFSSVTLTTNVWTCRYSMYSAVFMYKANMCGAFSSSDERTAVARLVQELMTSLERAATNKHHIAWRYSKLLSGLSFRPTSAIPSLRENIADMPCNRTSNTAASQPSQQASTAISDPVTLSESSTDVPTAAADSAPRHSPTIDPMTRDTSLPQDSDRNFDSSNFDLSDFQSTPQTDTFLETLFGGDIASFVPPFSDDIMF